MIAKRRNSLAFFILAIAVFFVLAAWESSNWKAVVVDMPVEMRGESPLDITKRCVCFYRWDRKLHEWKLKRCYCNKVKPTPEKPTATFDATETPTHTARPSDTPVPTWTPNPYPTGETPYPIPTGTPPAYP